MLRQPTGHFGPQPSPQLLHGWEVDYDDLRLVRWRVPVLRMISVDGFTLLDQLPASQDLHGLA